ncbi:UNVERIFIED_ORG: DNA-damage-inducible protein I [Rahnella aquatilis]
MHVELLIDKTKQLPAGAVEAFKAEFEKRLERNSPGAMFSERRPDNDGPRDKEVIDVMLQDT